MLGLGLSIPQVAARGSRSLVAVIRSLFAANEPGVWYDPSDLSTLYQDAAGTAPVTAVEQPVGLMLDKSKGLVLGPELVTNGDFSNGATGWTAEAVAPSSVTFSSGSVTIYRDAASSDPAIVNIGEGVLGKTYLVTFDVLSVSDQAKNIGVRFGQTGTIYPLSMIGPPGKKRFIVTANGSGLIAIRHGGSGPSTIVLDNISVRELPGNHAYQTTATSRPVLSARYNLLTKTEQFDDAVWGKTGVTVTPNTATAPNGTLTASKISETTATSKHEAYTLVAHVSGVQYTFKVFAKYSGRHLQIQPSSIFAGSDCYANFDLQNGALGVVGAGAAGATITNVGDGWYLCEMRATATSSSSTPQTTTMADILLITSPSDARGQAYTGDGTSGIYIWGADLRVANDGANLPPYQRVNTATDYDTVGFPHYLRFDGTDDGMATNSIDFSSTDKLTVCAGVRKLSDAVSSFVAEHGIGGVDARAATMITAPRSPTTLEYRSQIRDGTYVTESTSISRPAPDTAVHTHELDYAKPWLGKVKYRINGTAVISKEQGTGAATGNFGNYPLYLFKRDSSNPFNGRFYGMLIVGRLLSDSELRSTEKYVNTKTRAY